MGQQQGWARGGGGEGIGGLLRVCVSEQQGGMGEEQQGAGWVRSWVAGQEG